MCVAIRFGVTAVWQRWLCRLLARHQQPAQLLSTTLLASYRQLQDAEQQHDEYDRRVMPESTVHVYCDGLGSWLLICRVVNATHPIGAIVLSLKAAHDQP